jgi:hypothetical protein
MDEYITQVAEPQHVLILVAIIALAMSYIKQLWMLGFMVADDEIETKKQFITMLIPGFIILLFMVGLGFNAVSGFKSFIKYFKNLK